jgi:hypothetical protein
MWPTSTIRQLYTGMNSNAHIEKLIRCLLWQILFVWYCSQSQGWRWCGSVQVFSNFVGQCNLGEKIAHWSQASRRPTNRANENLRYPRRRSSVRIPQMSPASFCSIWSLRCKNQANKPADSHTTKPLPHITFSHYQTKVILRQLWIWKSWRRCSSRCELVSRASLQMLLKPLRLCGKWSLGSCLEAWNRAIANDSI